MERTGRGRESWKPLVVTATLVAAVFAVLWLGMTLTAEPESLLIAVVKIVFTIVVVLAAIAGLQWFTAAGISLLAASLLAVAWVLLRAPYYPPHGALRTVLLLVVPVGVAGAMLVLAGGIRAGTWPPGRVSVRRGSSARSAATPPPDRRGSRP